MSQEEGTTRARHKAMVRPALIAGKMLAKMRNGGFLTAPLAGSKRIAIALLSSEEVFRN